MKLRWAEGVRVWPTFILPSERGSMTALDAMAAAAGSERDKAIHAWCASVWEAYAGSRGQVLELLRQQGIL